jgi:MFS family permease
MVKDFAIVEDDTKIGYYAGFLAATFSLSQFVTGLGWGYLSDRYGRRPILLVGLLSNAVTMACFGLSKSYLWAIAMRVFAGLLNGNMGIAKSILADITDSSTRPFAFSLLGLMWGLGLITGPILGGFLSDPAKNIPSIFGNIEFFKTFRYFLPCFACSCFSGLAFISGIFMLPETAPNLGAYQFILEVDEADDIEEAGFAVPPVTSSPLILSQGKNASVSDIFKSLSLPPQDDRVQIWDAASEGIEVEEEDNPEHDTPIAISPLAVRTIFGYAMIALKNVIFEELFSLWAVAPVDNGLGLHPHQIGGILSIMGGLTLVSQLIVYPLMTKRWSPYKLYQVTLPIFLFVWAALPSLVYIAKDPLRQYLVPALTILMGLRRFAIVTTFTSMNIMITQAATDKTMGLVNGLAQTVISLVRGIGPIIGGSMWSWSVEHSDGFLSYYMVYFFLQLLTISGLIQSFFIEPEQRFELVRDESFLSNT